MGGPDAGESGHAIEATTGYGPIQHDALLAMVGGDSGGFVPHVHAIDEGAPT